MKKIVAYIQRTVTITTIKTAMDVLVSDDETNMPEILRHDPSIFITNLEGEKSEKTRDLQKFVHSAGRNSARRVRASRPVKGKSKRTDG